MGKQELKNIVKSFQNNEKVRETVKQRLKEFQQKNQEDNNSWFNELCFCLLTANSSAKKGIEIQNYLSRMNDFQQMSQEKLTEALKRMGHRFYQKRAEFIVEARKYLEIKEIITRFNSESESREWLVKSIKGKGIKKQATFSEMLVIIILLYLTGIFFVF